MNRTEIITAVVEVIRNSDKDLYWLLDADIKEVVKFIKEEMEAFENDNK